jgi:hypothetical protein
METNTNRLGVSISGSPGARTRAVTITKATAASPCGVQSPRACATNRPHLGPRRAFAHRSPCHVDDSSSPWRMRSETSVPSMPSRPCHDFAARSARVPEGCPFGCAPRLGRSRCPATSALAWTRCSHTALTLDARKSRHQSVTNTPIHVTIRDACAGASAP